MDPRISVAIPTFRRPSTLTRAIESVIAQDYESWEIVISDDEKVYHDTWRVGLHFAAQDGRIRIIKNSRGMGQAANTNNALLESQHPWIKLLHDDDWLAPGSLKRFAEVAAQHPKAAFISCACNSLTDKGIELYRPRRQLQRDTVCVLSYQGFLRDLYLLNITKEIGMSPSTLLVNRLSLTEDSLMESSDISIGIDKPFLIKLARHGEVVTLREGLTFYDQTDHPSITAIRGANYERVDLESLAVKKILFDLIEDKTGLPLPETMEQAQRFARLRTRLRKQPWRASIKLAACALDPRVAKLIAARLLRRGPWAT